MRLLLGLNCLGFERLLDDFTEGLLLLTGLDYDRERLEAPYPEDMMLT